MPKIRMKSTLRWLEYWLNCIALVPLKPVLISYGRVKIITRDRLIHGVDNIRPLKRRLNRTSKT